MTTVNDILQFVETLAPLSMKMDWDNVGLLCGSGSAPVTRVLVALDPFSHVCREAADWGAELLLTHHPLIFTAPRAITDQSDLGQSIQTLCAHGISAINAHTNLDCAPGGVNDTLAAALGLSQISVIDPQGTDDQGRPWGLLRQGTLAQMSLSDFLPQVKQALGCQGLRYVAGGKPVHRVAVGGGSCADEMGLAAAAGCDTFVTADVKYNQFWDARALGLNLIDAGHFCTENPVTAVLARAVSDRFPEITVKISDSHRDCMKFY